MFKNFMMVSELKRALLRIVIFFSLLMARGGSSTAAGGNATVVDPSQNPGDVYYVHASDVPSTIVVKPVLTHSNYQAWARSMKRALGGKNKLDFVDGNIEVPSEFDPNFKAWNRCNMLVHSGIMNSVDESIAQSIAFLDNVVDVWNELKERFSQGDYIRISELQCEIFGMKQESRSVSEFFTALKILWEELDSYLPAPVCSCLMRCICNTGVSNAKHQHKIMRSIRFLTGLNENFDPVRAQILLMNPLPTINRIFSMVLQHERQYNSTHFDDSKVLVNSHDARKPKGRCHGSSSSQGNRSNSYGANNYGAKNKECSYCGKTNHIVENCYRKHGFPPHYGRNSHANNASLEHVDERENMDDNKSVRGNNNNTDFGFTKEQYNQLMTLIQSSNTSNQASSSTHVNIATGHVASGIRNLTCSLSSSPLGQWIVDSGASDHICSSLKYFSSYKSITHVHVRLPNGHASIAKYAGTVKDNLRMTGLAKLIEGLYYLHILPDQVQSTIASSHTISATDQDSRARKAVYLGHKQGVKGAVLFDLNTKSIFISRNVTYHEHILPYQNSNPPFQWSYHSTHTPQNDIPSVPGLYDSEPLVPTSNISIPPIETNPNSSDDITHHNTDLVSTTTPETIFSNTDDIHETDTINLRRSTRTKSFPSHLSDYVCNLSTDVTKSSSSGILYPISHFHSYANLSASHNKFALPVTNDVEPMLPGCGYGTGIRYRVEPTRASTQDCWVKAMNGVLQALQQNKTWIIVDTPLHVKPVGSRWVYKVKHKADGSIERYKARLVAKAISSWHLHQLDVNNAFLHGDLHEEVYMTIPQGVTHSKPNQVCKLLKSLYGLKQASRKWYEKLTGVLLSQGYKQSSSDHSLFTLHRESSFTVLLVYVDDIILADNSLDEFTRIKQILDDHFKIKDLGQLKYFLGIEVAHSSQGISICQIKYCLDLLQDTGLLGAKPAKTPLDPSVKLHQDTSPPFADIAGYRRLIGKLLYLTTTRPDIAFVTQQLNFSDCRVVRYLKGSPGRGLFFRRDSQLQLLGFTDVDWAGCLDSRRYTSGYCFFLGSSLISWRAKKQHTVARNSYEAEYRALSFAACELSMVGLSPKGFGC
ncbi:hypothetical protein TSUD_399420 [Trifolium subterraneum]|uniref:Reverse transcriptase Ty1/copia-type domain-containing protein n=1 Tax=Trifolium subterraneum TaxID=3900 RepID=A0A2Z6NHC1_TRISU|nr:hypothetical protein TSUD_399420 [Trifolium subterraneum]